MHVCITAQYELQLEVVMTEYMPLHILALFSECRAPTMTFIWERKLHICLGLTRNGFN